MLRVAVLDACFPIDKQDSVGLAAMWLKATCAPRFELARPSLADVVLVTCVASEQVKYVERVRKMFARATVFVGGAASTSPAAFVDVCDGVCVGDGRRFLDALQSGGIDAALAMDNVLAQNKKSVSVDNGFPWDFPPIQAEDGAYRVWAGRGCKNKCAFCQTGWSIPYAENPNPELMIRHVKKLLAGKEKVAYLSNDLTQHSFFKRLPMAQHGSFSYRYIKKHGLPPARQVRLGVEGVSERLRGAVNKPIPHGDLVKCTSWLNANGKSVRWFMIAGLPGETDEDWQELREAVQWWKRTTPKGVLALSFTAWCPDPATPIATLPLDDGYWPRYEAFREWFFGGQGWSNKVKLMGPQQPKSRLEKAMWSMCLSKSELYRGGDPGPNNVVAYPYKEAAQKVKQNYCASVGLPA